MKQAGETDERLFAVAAWRDAPYFSDAERAALALAEALTRLSDRADAVPDEIWDEAARHYNERALAGLLLAIATINVWNRQSSAKPRLATAWLFSTPLSGFGGLKPLARNLASADIETRF